MKIPKANHHRYRKRWFNPQYLTLTYIVLLVVARISRRWNQTGQKFAGSPDIARTFLTEHTNVLWSLVGATYLWNLNSLVTVAFARLGQLLAGTIGSALTTAALTFKLAFTDADSPELLPEFMRTLAGLELGGSLVTRARIVFVGIAAALVFTVAEGFRSTKRPNCKYCACRPLCSVNNCNSDAPEPTRTSISVPHHTVSCDQHSAFPSLLGPALSTLRSRSHHDGNHDHVLTAPASFILCIRQLERHLLYRSLERLQRCLRLQRNRSRHSHFRIELVWANILDIRDCPPSSAAQTNRRERCALTTLISLNGLHSRVFGGCHGSMYILANSSVHLDRLLTEISLYHGLESRTTSSD